MILLAVNILEAVVAESVDLITGGATRALGGHPANIYAGLLVLLTIRRADRLEVTPDAERRMNYDLGWDWIAAYSLWNFVFLYGSRPPGVPHAILTGVSLIHLGAPLLAARTDARAWLELRGFALLWIVALVMAANRSPFILETVDWYWRPLADALSLASAVLATVVFYRRGLLRGVVDNWRWR